MDLLVMADQQHARLTAYPISPNHLSSGVSFLKEKRIRRSSKKDETETAAGKAMFHDFLGSKPAATDPQVALAHKNLDASPSVSVSHGGGSSGGGRAPLSTTSDLVSSERHRGHHLEGIPYHGPRNDLSVLEASNRTQKNKRSNSDSAFTVSTKDGAPRTGHDSLESFHMKMFKNGGGGERSKRSYEDDGYYSMQPVRSPSGTLIVHPSAACRHDPKLSKWERSIPMGGAASLQYSRGNQFTPFSNQVPSNRLRDSNPGSSVVFHTAADEGSRTGMKGPGILNSIIASEKSPPAIPHNSGKHKSAEADCSPSSHPSLSSASRQMTIFYGGQAHVFDDVHPNKADVIMALAGSNGGSWSTTYSPKAMGRAVGESLMGGGEYEGGSVQLRREPRGRLSIVSNASQGQGHGDSTAAPPAGKS